MRFEVYLLSSICVVLLSDYCTLRTVSQSVPKTLENFYCFSGCPNEKILSNFADTKSSRHVPCIQVGEHQKC